MDLTKFSWTRKPKSYKINQDTIEIVTNPHTDLWQRTYYHFQNDNAPVLQMETEEKFQRKPSPFRSIRPIFKCINLLAIYLIILLKKLNHNLTL